MFKFTPVRQIFLWYFGRVDFRIIFMDSQLLIVAVLGAFLSFIVYDTYWRGEVEYVVSNVDGNSYLVRSLPDKQQAADLLAFIRQQLETTVRHLEKHAPSDPRTQRLVQNFRGDALSEGTESKKYTSYSINKGEKIVFCLRSREEGEKLMDKNTMTFVALHELAHVGSEEIGHTPEFWENFRWILEEAVNIGVYRKQDFKAKPVKYCGVDITDSPLK